MVKSELCFSLGGIWNVCILPSHLSLQKTLKGLLLLTLRLWQLIVDFQHYLYCFLATERSAFMCVYSYCLWFSLIFQYDIFLIDLIYCRRVSDLVLPNRDACYCFVILACSIFLDCAQLL